MLRTTVKRVFCGGPIGLLVALTLTASAQGSGSCGHDIKHPCGLNTPASTSGVVQSIEDTHFFHFYGLRGTVLTVTLTDTDSPSCNGLGPACGDLLALLVNQGRTRRPLSYSTPFVGYRDAEAPTISFSVSLPATQAYLLEVGGEPGLDAFGRSVPVSYAVQVAASPAVHWPAPCTVAKLGRRASLAAWKRAIVRGRCAIGRIRHLHSGRVPRGRVIGVLPPTGSVLPYRTAVTIIVSAGPARHKRR